MEAGHHMHQFSTEIFKKLDRAERADNLVLLNGHFLESIEGIGNKLYSSK